MRLNVYNFTQMDVIIAKKMEDEITTDDKLQRETDTKLH